MVSNLYDEGFSPVKLKPDIYINYTYILILIQQFNKFQFLDIICLCSYYLNTRVGWCLFSTFSSKIKYVYGFVTLYYLSYQVDKSFLLDSVILWVIVFMVWNLILIFKYHMKYIIYLMQYRKCSNKIRMLSFELMWKHLKFKFWSCDNYIKILIYNNNIPSISVICKIFNANKARTLVSIC